MKTSGENVFNITAPARYRCQVYRYHNTLSRLYLSVYKDERPDPAFYLLFSDVGYFAGPLSWQSADFHIWATESCLELMVEAGLLDEQLLSEPTMRAYFEQMVRLYVVELSRAPVKIIAGSATLLQSIPTEI